MATIILNGVSTDANPLSATALNDKLTISGGLDGYEADMLAGKDLVEIDQAGEDIVSSIIFGGDDDDAIYLDSSAFFETSSDITLSGGEGDDAIGVGLGWVEDADGDDLPEGMVTFTGKANGNAGDDFISIVRADGAEIQGGADNDEIDLGYWNDLDQAGSRADSTFVNTFVGGGSGDDEIDLESGLKATDSSINGGDGEDTLYVDGSHTGSILIEAASSANFITSSDIFGGNAKDVIHLGWYSDGEDLSLVNTIVNGNKGGDWIKSYGPFAATDGSIIAGGAGHDTIAVADAGPLTVRGGSGKDMLRIGSGQTVTGGANADTFSIEFAGGATIQDFDALTENCFCSDVIQVDVNKIVYNTYDYKSTKEKYTSASSWRGNIRVKAFAQEETCTTNVGVNTGATKTKTLNLSAFLNYKITEINPEATFGDLNAGTFPATWNGELNGNAPRPDGDVRGFGYGAGVVSGIIRDRDVTADGRKYRDVYLPNLTVYTTEKFEKGDFSFLNQTINGNAKCTVTQTLVFDDVTRATITNHWVDFGFSKNTVETSLLNLKFGTANFKKIYTGRANLIMTKGLEDNLYYPTPDQITNNLTQKTINNVNDIVYNAFQTADGKWKYTRTANATANAGVELNLSSQVFDLYTKIDSGIGNAFGDVKTYPTNDRVTLLPTPIRTFKGTVTTDNGFYKYEDVRWSWVTNAGLLTHTIATQVTGNVNGKPYTPAQNHPLINGFFSSPTSALNGYLATRQFYDGKTAKISDTREIQGSLIAKIAIQGTNDNAVSATLPTWLGRALIKGTELVPTDCTYPSVLTDEVIAQGFGNNQHNKYTPASVSPSNKGEFNTKYLWTSSGAQLGTKHTYTVFNYYNFNLDTPTLGSTGNIYNPNSIIPAAWTTYSSSFFTTNFGMTDLKYSNGCPTSSYGVKEYSCSTRYFDGTTRVNAKTAIFGFNGEGTVSGLIARAERTYSNNAFFSASKFTPVVLAAAGMGENAIDAEGAPFRVLFFDTKGSDNGLYVMSGTANYKDNAVTAINTNSTAPSGMGGKQTIVKVTGGKGYEISLSDINFV